MTPRDRYNAAHKLWCHREFPEFCKAGGYFAPKYPKVDTTNGITTFIENYITWIGGYCNRINVSGRMVGKITKTESGKTFDDRKWIKSATRRGTADTHVIWQGKHISIEVKNAATKDKIRPEQLKEKQRIERAGGHYMVVTSVEDFLSQWDAIMYGN